MNESVRESLQDGTVLWHGHPLDFARDRPGRVFTGFKPVPLEAERIKETEQT
ncbi:MAG TPA: hypothetical protein HPP66_03405 [Planctomycetes bacterium]|nr:hypothetical protein [Planctomycetota bacterium]